MARRRLVREAHGHLSDFAFGGGMGPIEPARAVSPTVALFYRIFGQLLPSRGDEAKESFEMAVAIVATFAGD